MIQIIGRIETNINHINQKAYKKNRIKIKEIEQNTKGELSEKREFSKDHRSFWA